MEALAPIEIDGRRIGPGHPVYIVAEVGSNHNGDRSLALRLIDEAARAGADAVKFQLFRADWLYPRNCGVVDTPMGAVDFFELLGKYELEADWVGDLKSYANQRGLAFLCTAFDEQSLRHLTSLGVPAVKMASPELNHLPLLRVAAALRTPMLCSTGLCTLADVEEALLTIRAVWPEPQVALLQCVSAYPLPAEDSNLRVIDTLHRAFGLPVGLSDHTMDCEIVPSVAVAAGAALIEKHYTVSRDLKGPDHAFALEPAELRQMVRTIRALDELDPCERMEQVSEMFSPERVNAILGHGRKEIMESERSLYPNDKRSIHAVCDIAAGDYFTSENVRVLRSERNLTPGLHPRYWQVILGGRASRAVQQGQGIGWNDLIVR